MKILIFQHNLYTYGGSSLYKPYSTRLELELNPEGYGTAISELTVEIALPENLGKLTKAEKTKFGIRPRKRIIRKSGKVSIHYLSEFSTHYEEDSASLKEINAVSNDVLNAMLLVGDIVKPTDDFDTETFLAHVRKILSRKFKSKKEINEEDDRWREGLPDKVTEELEDQLENPSPTSPLQTFEVTWPYEKDAPKSFDLSTFLSETRCISQWYSRLLGRKLKGFTPRLFIHLGENLTRPVMHTVTVLGCPFDFTGYFALEDTQRKELIARTLHEGLTFFANQFGENPTLVDQALSRMQADKFCFRGELKQRFVGSRLTARVEFEYGTNGMKLVAVFSKKGARKILKRVSLGVCPPHPWLLNVIGSSFKWKGTKFHFKFNDHSKSVETKSIQ